MLQHRFMLWLQAVSLSPQGLRKLPHSMRDVRAMQQCNETPPERLLIFIIEYLILPAFVDIESASNASALCCVPVEQHGHLLNGQIYWQLPLQHHALLLHKTVPKTSTSPACKEEKSAVRGEVHSQKGHADRMRNSATVIGFL